MTKAPTAPVQSWKNSRYGLVAFLVGSLVLGMTLLRVLIFLKFTHQSDVTGGEIARAFLIGLHQDCVVALFASLPLLFWFWIKRERSFGKRWHATLLIIGSFMFWAVQVFLLFTEYYFFEEFRSRFNTVAVDYLLYPDEVVGNIRESYPLFTILAICGTVALAWVLAAFWTFRGMWSQSVPSRSRFLRFAGATALAAALLFTV